MYATANASLSVQPDCCRRTTLPSNFLLCSDTATMVYRWTPRQNPLLLLPERKLLSKQRHPELFAIVAREVALHQIFIPMYQMLLPLQIRLTSHLLHTTALLRAFLVRRSNHCQPAHQLPPMRTSTATRLSHQVQAVVRLSYLVCDNTNTRGRILWEVYLMKYLFAHQVHAHYL